uniref:Uncharacterized protein n=1 Tax=Timema tahoe TaxID=61484 RepID=A0A7R9NXU6_9NEOP|nr:unnamed protein product [Timema tahoe]
MLPRKGRREFSVSHIHSNLPLTLNWIAVGMPMIRATDGCTTLIAFSDHHGSATLCDDVGVAIRTLVPVTLFQPHGSHNFIPFLVDDFYCAIQGGLEPLQCLAEILILLWCVFLNRIRYFTSVLVGSGYFMVESVCSESELTLQPQELCDSVKPHQFQLYILHFLVTYLILPPQEHGQQYIHAGNQLVSGLVVHFTSVNHLVDLAEDFNLHSQRFHFHGARLIPSLRSDSFEPTFELVVNQMGFIPSIILVFLAEENLHHLVLITNPAQFRAGLSAETNAGMSTFQPSVARLLTRMPVTDLMASPGATLVLALPITKLLKRII